MYPSLNEIQQETLEVQDKHKPHNAAVSNGARILNILDNLFVEPLDVTSCQTHGENTNQNIVESTVEDDKTRFSGMFVSKNVFNLSHRALTDSEIRVLDKWLNFFQH